MRCEYLELSRLDGAAVQHIAAKDLHVVHLEGIRAVRARDEARVEDLTTCRIL